ncbi:hypothetical protein [Polyangium sp. y55x31]|uniref:hypothetical protein n=1 Tax=Polyangium sp. y55x31 TaxID=3042688 RepID=UPI0024831801|nr:hypothetical protein [Polyangium sp. y55x31]MDI1478899.1 hypothetical protein [Polyangium sp. y55x31]
MQGNAVSRIAARLAGLSVAVVLALAAGCSATNAPGVHGEGGAAGGTTASTGGAGGGEDFEPWVGPPRAFCGFEQPCKDGYFCSFGPSCQGPGHCMSKTTCTPMPGAVCGCDGKVYADDCAARAAGVDVTRDACATPPGTFSCQQRFCKAGEEACLDDIFFNDGWCAPLPEACKLDPNPTDCACFGVSAPCSDCSVDANGQFIFTCYTLAPP